VRARRTAEAVRKGRLRALFVSCIIVSLFIVYYYYSDISAIDF